MADNTILNQGTGGDTITTEEQSGGDKTQVVKGCFGSGGSNVKVDRATPLPVQPQEIAISPESVLSAYLSQNGGGSVFDGTGVYNVSAAQFELAPASGEAFLVHRVEILLVAAAAISLHAGNYAGFTLSAGYSVKVMDSDDVEVADLLNDVNVLRLEDLVDVSNRYEINDRSARFVLEFARPIFLSDTLGTRLEVELNDDFGTGSHLVRHRFRAHGLKMTEASAADHALSITEDT